MFLVEDKRDGATYLVFTWKNPKNDGYAGPVIEGADLGEFKGVRTLSEFVCRRQQRGGHCQCPNPSS